MTHRTPIKIDEKDLSLQREYRDFIARCARRIGALLDDAEAGIAIDARDAARLVKDLHSAHKAFLDIERQISHDQTNAAAPLDFDRIRDEIGRKLNRLRETLDPDAVSKGVD